MWVLSKIFHHNASGQGPLERLPRGEEQSLRTLERNNDLVSSECVFLTIFETNVRPINVTVIAQLREFFFPTVAASGRRIVKTRE